MNLGCSKVNDDNRCAESGRSTYDDLLEAQRFRDFLPTKNGIMVFELRGDGRFQPVPIGVASA